MWNSSIQGGKIECFDAVAGACKLMLLCVIFSCIITQITAVPVTLSSKPAFCHGLDCPVFTVIKTLQDGSELRKYEATKWVATNVTAIEYTHEISRELFYRLFHYISGNNTAHKKIAMTAPVLRKVVHSQGPACEATFVEHFMISHDIQTTTPSPTDPKVYLVTIPGMEVYVKSFGGRPSDLEIAGKAQELAEEIGNPDLYVDSFYYQAGYDDIHALNRHNEVWLVAKSSKSPSSGSLLG